MTSRLKVQTDYTDTRISCAKSSPSAAIPYCATLVWVITGAKPGRALQRCPPCSFKSEVSNGTNVGRRTDDIADICGARTCGVLLVHVMLEVGVLALGLPASQPEYHADWAGGKKCEDDHV